MFAEVGFLWSYHQMHHSTQLFNFTNSLRQAVIQVELSTDLEIVLFVKNLSESLVFTSFQDFCGFLFELPQALFLPPSVYIIHRYLEINFQFWIHTKVTVIQLSKYLFIESRN